MIDPMEIFEAEKVAAIDGIARDKDFHNLTRQWFDASCRHRYSYHFSWMGLPIIQYPQDMVAMQELIWRIKPRVIVETGVAHGGSLAYYASLLELLHGDGIVIGIDIEIRPHNLAAIKTHPMFPRIRLIQGSSIDAAVLTQVAHDCEGRTPIMVVLDSNHSHDHVSRELDLYSPLVTAGSYLVVFDTVVEDMPESLLAQTTRPWGRGNNPKTAVREFLQRSDRFVVDELLEAKLQITVAPSGYLKCVR